MASTLDGGKNERHCCVPNCNGNGRRNPELSFHQIPQRLELRKAWIHAIRRDPGPLFRRDDFKWTPVRKTLKKESVPSIFNWKSDEKAARREIFKHPVPEKMPRFDTDENNNNPVSNENLNLNVESSHTWKGLVGIAPHGALTFVSSLYTGNMSDVEITKLSGLIDLLDRGDSIMADKGFVLNKVLEGTGISVNTPPFLQSQGQFSRQEVEQTQVIAKLRIHIERHIRRVKEYHLFDGVIPLSMVGTINQLWTVANMLTLFKGPLVKEWK
ncbi:uncharacterized protein LOC125676468 [Ostrea edulis]|uniref:uncharacterized protein LOC125676468 n=1 Tax=Ostrea edulis TaxID=37623 RepID=UPI0024AF3BA4|nr:uncharacterized protein LOC125676468 [Ostrea edulis]